MHFNCANVVRQRYTEVYLIVLKWNYCKYTSGTLNMSVNMLIDLNYAYY